MLSYVSVVQSALVPLSPLSAVPPLPLCPEIPTRGVSECQPSRRMIMKLSPVHPFFLFLRVLFNYYCTLPFCVNT